MCAAATISCAFCTTPASAQVVGSVYMDDSPSAQDGLIRAVELAQVGNLDEASKVLQRLLDESAELLLLESPADADLFVTVRRRVHAELIANPRLLERYRALENPAARALLDTDQISRAERTRLLTSAGLDAALRLAQQFVDGARFHAAARLLADLDAHPDLQGERLTGAVTLLDSCVSFLNAQPPTEKGPSLEAWTRLRASWRERAELPDAPAPRAEAPAIEPERSPLEPQPPANLGEVLKRPLASEYTGASIDGVQYLAEKLVQAQRGISPRAAVLHAIPAVSGDTLYINDSETITAWDRYTLSKRWRVRIEPPTTITNIASNGGLGVEDCNWVSVRGRRLATISGLAQLTRNQLERSISVLDTRDGRVLWTTTFSQLGPDVLRESFPRGPAIIDQGVVVVSAARNSIEKRLQGALLLGLDLEKGDLLWYRNLGSLGVVPWNMSAFPADLTRVHEGVAYRADRIGVITAIDTVTGRVLWSRRLAPDPLAGSGISRGGGSGRIVPWEGNTPVVHQGRVIVLSPDKRIVTSIEASSGRVLERVPAQVLNNPDYLLLAPASGGEGKTARGPSLIAVAPSQIGMIDLTETGTIAGTTYRLLAAVLAPGIRGRVSIAGDELVVPTLEGVSLVPIKPGPSPTMPPEQRQVALNRSGHMLALGGQLIAVDDQQAHSYLLWETADELLESRMKADPTNPVPAVTHAELAYQAGKQDRLVPAVDRAVRTLERDPLSASTAAARRRLFVSLSDMIEPPPDAPIVSRLGDAIRSDLTARLEQLAATPAEQVRATFAAASLSEAAGRVPEAVERYQTVLLTPALARETYSRAGSTLPADAEATRRLRRLVREHGPNVYAAFEAEAVAKLEQARAAGNDADLESLARAYPVSSAAPRAWLEIARRNRAVGREAPALAALDEAMNAAQSSLTSSDALLSEVGAEVVARAAESDRPRAALRMIEAVERSLAGRPLTDPRTGAVVDVPTLRAALNTRLHNSERKPIVGPLSGPVSVLTGWGVVSPICGEAPGAPTDRVVLASATGEIGLWRTAHKPGAAPLLEKVWSDPDAEAFLRIDARSVLLARSTARPGSPPNAPRNDLAFIRRDIESGNVTWEIPAFRPLFSERSRRAAPGNDERIDTPLRTQVPASEVVILVDDRTMVLIDRVGRAAAFDYDNGRLLWAAELAVDRLYDASLSDGVLAVTGVPARTNDDAPPRPDVVPAAKTIEERRNIAAIDPREQPEPENATPQGVVCVVQVLGARTGISQGILSEPTDTRWVRITPEGWVIYAHADGITCLDPYRLETRWRNDAPPARDSINAWPAPGRMITRDADGRFRLLNTDTGELSPNPLDTLGKADQSFLDAAAATIPAPPTAPGFKAPEPFDRTAILSSRGIVMHDAIGKVVGADALGADTAVRLPVLAAGAALLVELGPIEVPMGGGMGGGMGGESAPSVFAVHLVSTLGGKLIGQARFELPRSPTDAAIIDHTIIISSGSASVLIGAPANP
ncbi:MAG: PQQ-binding-like beta-propeller repeat protein [Phycisphaerales bacterium]